MSKRPDQNLTRRSAGRKTIRASVSFDADDYRELEVIAERDRVSVAWVVRDAVSQYLERRNPLFADHHGPGSRA